MFNCERCGQTSAPGEEPVRIVVQTREKVYLPNYHTGDKGGQGREIVREEVVCRLCADKVIGKVV